MSEQVLLSVILVQLIYIIIQMEKWQLKNYIDVTESLKKKKWKCLLTFFIHVVDIDQHKQLTDILITNMTNQNEK